MNKREQPWKKIGLLSFLAMGLLFVALRVQHKSVLNAALIEAVNQGDVPWAQDLLRQGADADTAKPWFRSVPPSFEQWHWFRENISDKGNAPEPVLCLAAENHNLTMVDVLLAHGADINSRSCHDYTVLSYASGDALLTQDLLRHGANPNAQDIFGDPALPTAARSNTPKLGTTK